MLIDKQYELIYLDPPWAYNSKACHTTSFRGGACGHYNVMKMADLANLDFARVSAPNSVMMMWGTAPMLPEQIKLMEHWGWKYKTIGFVWIKLNKKANSFFMGPGAYTRANSEFVLIGVRGKYQAPEARNIFQPILSRLEQHSRKPDVARHRIELLYPQLLPRAEFFATEVSEGWDCYGFAIDGMDVRDYVGIK